jgi:O-antigen/teichoic acid export membrane protein
VKRPQAAGDLLRLVIANAGKVTGGRLMLALMRFGATLLLVQRAGMERYGEFALILGFILVAEWLSDFGMSDIAVRQLAAAPARRRATMGAFVVAKAGQGLLASAVLGLAVTWGGYAPDVAQSAWIAAGAVLCYTGVQVFRVEFRARMQMGRDAGAELLSAVVFLVAIWVATRVDASLQVLTLCYVLSRAVNLAAAAWLARGWPAFGFDDGFRAELRVLGVAAIPLGFTGLMVAVYDTLPQIVLSQASSSEEVGLFSFAMRAMMLALVAEQALATAVFPVLAAQWARDQAAFMRTLQSVLDWGLLLGGALLCFIHTGAPWLVSLVRADPRIADVLQLLSWAIPARAAVALVGPMLLISGRLMQAVWIPVLVVAALAAALSMLAERGAVGAAAAFLIAELGVGLLPNLWFCQWAPRLWLRWSVPLRIAGAAAAVVLATQWLGLQGTGAQAVLATAGFLALAAALGAVRLRNLQALYDSYRRRHHDDT